MYWNQDAAYRDALNFFENRSPITDKQGQQIKENFAYPIFQTILSKVLWNDRNAFDINYTLPEHNRDIEDAKELAVSKYHFTPSYVDDFYKWLDDVTPKPLDISLPEPVWYEAAPWSWILGGIIGTSGFEIAKFPAKKWWAGRRSSTPRRSQLPKSGKKPQKRETQQ